MARVLPVTSMRGAGLGVVFPRRGFVSARSRRGQLRLSPSGGPSLGPSVVVSWFEALWERSGARLVHSGGIGRVAGMLICITVDLGVEVGEKQAKACAGSDRFDIGDWKKREGGLQRLEDAEKYTGTQDQYTEFTSCFGNQILWSTIAHCTGPEAIYPSVTRL